MGMDQSVIFASKALPSWPAVRALLQQRGLAVQMRMIDGQLAFPDEQPPENWTELRVALPQGMVTVRRGEDRLVFVTWGNADAALRQAWNALAWACTRSRRRASAHVTGASGCNRVPASGGVAGGAEVRRVRDRIAAGSTGALAPSEPCSETFTLLFAAARSHTTRYTKRTVTQFWCICRRCCSRQPSR